MIVNVALLIMFIACLWFAYVKYKTKLKVDYIKSSVCWLLFFIALSVAQYIKKVDECFLVINGLFIIANFIQLLILLIVYRNKAFIDEDDID